MSAPPRYLPGRALPASRYVPGRATRPSTDDAAVASPAASAGHSESGAQYRWGVDLYNAGYFWEAHEAWEHAWRATASGSLQHGFLQGLIQCAAACLKGVMGDANAARRIAARALEHLSHVLGTQGDIYMALDLARFIPAFRAFVTAHPTEPEQRPLIWLIEERDSAS